MVVMHLLPSNCINWQCFVPQFEYYFLTFHFSWAAWFPLLLVKFHDLSSFQSWTMCCVYVYISQLPLLVTNSTVWKYMQNPITNACKFWSRIFLNLASQAQNWSKIYSFSSNLRSFQLLLHPLFQSQEVSTYHLFSKDKRPRIRHRNDRVHASSVLPFRHAAILGHSSPLIR